MLLNNLFSISAQEHSPGMLKANVRIDETHPIFKGHFPGLPILPGVAMIQLVRELMEVQLGRKLRISEVGNLKFLSVINPEKNKEVEVTISYTETDGNLLTSATILERDVIFFKAVKATLQNA